MHAQKFNSCKGGTDSSFCFAVNWDDGYLAAVRALLKKAFGKLCTAQLQFAQSLAWLLKAVPAWMLTFGDANNQGCTALTGLRAFQVGLCSQLHTAAPKAMKLKMHCIYYVVYFNMRVWFCNNLIVCVLALSVATALLTVA